MEECVGGAKGCREVEVQLILRVEVCGVECLGVGCQVWELREGEMSLGLEGKEVRGERGSELMIP